MRLTALTCLTLCLVSAVHAETAGNANTSPVTVLDGTLTTTATLTSDYVFRGFSQNDEKISPLLGASWVHKSGVHADLFGAPVDFNADDDASVEIDATLGYTHAFTDKLSGDVSAVYYAYPGSDSDADYDYVEGVGSLSYNWGVAKTSGLLAYSPDFFGSADQSLFAEAVVDAPLHVGSIEGLSAIGGLGRQMVEDGIDYNTWRAGVNYAVKGFNLGLTYYDTNIGDDQCDSLCGARAVVSAGRTF